MRIAVSRAFVALTLVALLSAPADAAQQRTQKKEPPPPPPQFQVSEPTRLMAFSRINSQVAPMAPIGKLGHFFCSPEKTFYGQQAFAGVSLQDLALNFESEANAAGYRVVGASSNLFDGAEAKAPQLVIGAIIQDLKISGCYGAIGQVGGEGNVDGTITVEWQVYDPIERKVLLKITTQGSGKARALENLIAAHAMRAAFQNAAKVVLAAPEFVAAVRDPNGMAPAPENSLFPEAQSSKSEATKPDLPKQIPHVALSMTPFSAQVDALRKQVVTIHAPGGSGSGFYIAPGLLLTNAHVVRGTTTFKAKFLDGHESAGVVLASDAKRDIALLMAENNGPTGLPLRTEPPNIGSRVYIIGSPLDEALQGSVSSGIISAFRNFEPTRSGIVGKFIQSDVEVNPGNSGGPMFDEFGNVIGVTVLKVGETSINLFIPIDDALKVLGMGIEPALTAVAKP